MSFYQIDRNKDYMKEMWGTTSLITDYKQQNSTKKSPSGDYARSSTEA